jgi:hypothetical protein
VPGLTGLVPLWGQPVPAGPPLISDG